MSRGWSIGPSPRNFDLGERTWANSVGGALNQLSRETSFTPSAHSHSISDLSDLPSTYTPSAHTHDASDVADGTLDDARLSANVALLDSNVTFATQVDVGDAAAPYLLLRKSETDPSIWFAEGVDGHRALIRRDTGELQFHVEGVASGTPAVRLQIGNGGAVRPGADGTQSLGASGEKWSEVWAVNGAIQTSERSAKIINDELPGGLALSAAQAIPVYRYTYLSDASARPHVGVMADEIPGWMRFDEAGLNYGTIASVALAACKELARRLEALEERISNG